MNDIEEKFAKKHTTSLGHNRAFVKFTGLKTLWFNTGTLCNLSCDGCYIESSPINNKLLYLNTKDVDQYLQQIKKYNFSCDTIGFTGWEPFMNKDIISILNLCKKENYNILILTNAMQPMLNKIKELKTFATYKTGFIVNKFNDFIKTFSSLVNFIEDKNFKLFKLKIIFSNTEIMLS